MFNRSSRRDDAYEAERQLARRVEQSQGDLFGFGAFDRMFREQEQAMDSMMRGMERDMSLATRTGGGNELFGGMLSAGQPQQGQYSSQVYVSSTCRGPDGKEVTEQYQSSTVGDAERRLREQQEMYTNSGTGLDKMALERTMGEQGRRVVRSRNRNTGDQNTQDMFRGGLTEENAAEFDQRWKEDAVPYLPRHGASGMQALGGARYSSIEDVGDQQSRRRSREQRQLTGI
ncbi:Myeloid leukemia factor, putative [Perkinsus marinus ATCC 50983]|uniref:Myeloid leukemia factor, putative n=1 Tax=Perkinsus marinus (strain ATCC 50983 / TXsc) TaxID=423536 RepID=C5KHD6_PERM5|nr:Myeloid leukemia factor, putative [Perkinsus marinus ATCC 50983]EER15998.1 Myeloid leukemia factor, putative [Perkinsus marinus ATCC 50983]|eukprot:XP_002784202.1 Myeloid leukemia factor, putative [Perkinsus marinus ATCC 50983]